MHRQKSPGDDPALGRAARSEADVDAVLDAVLDPVADAVVEQDVGLDAWVTSAEGFDHRPEHVLQHRARRHDAQRPGDLFPTAPRAMHRMLQRGQAGLGGFQKLAAFFREAQAARSAVEQPHAQMRLELHQRMAGRLWRDALRGGRLAQAAEFGGLGKGRNGAEFVDGHGGD